MKAFLLLLLVGFVAAAPTSKESSEDDLVVIDKDFYPKQWRKYSADHDIVKILVPLNSLNFDEDSSSESNEDEVKVTLFFVEGDLAADGTYVNKGLYVLKDNVATKLLDNGKDMAASGDDSKLVFLGASDGIYVYKENKNDVEKYGSINDDIINIVKEKSGDVIYILTADKEVFKVTDDGNKKEKIEDIVNAEQIILDYSNNIYFYGADKKPYVRTSEGVKAISGLPDKLSNVLLVKPPFLMDDSVPFLVNNATYILYANGTSEAAGIEFQPKYKPSAFGPEAALIQYYAYDKKIYEYNILEILLGGLLEELKNYLDDQKDTLQSIASNKKSSIKSHIL